MQVLRFSPRSEIMTSVLKLPCLLIPGVFGPRNDWTADTQDSYRARQLWEAMAG